MSLPFRGLIVSVAILFQVSLFAGADSDCPKSFEKLIHLINRNYFETKRDFEQYAELLPPSFLTSLSALNKNGHWIDAGSGEGFALQDLFNQTVLHLPTVLENAKPSFWRSRRILIDVEKVTEAANKLNFRDLEDKPKVTGVTYKMERKIPNIPNLEIKSGRFFEEIPLGEFEPADLISDLFGVASYTPRLDEVLGRYHYLLKERGRAYVFLGDKLVAPEYLESRRVQPIEEIGWYAPFAKSTVKRADGTVVSLLDWVLALPEFTSSIEFTQIEKGSRSSSLAGVIERSTLVLEKRAGESHIPKLLLVDSDEGKPPTRRFEEVSD